MVEGERLLREKLAEEKKGHHVRTKEQIRDYRATQPMDAVMIN